MEIAKLLVEKGADINLSDKQFNNGETPLYWAVQNNRLEMLKVLVGTSASNKEEEKMRRERRLATQVN